VSRRPSSREIADTERYLLAQQARFRRAADALAAAFADFPEVRAVALFGSVARPLWREVPRFSDFRRYGIEVWHECKDVDIAAAIDRLDNLRALGQARSRALNALCGPNESGVAHHQADVFLFGRDWRDYLGRLCPFATCPKGKRECLAPGCGRMPFLKQHENFRMDSHALDGGRSLMLYERGRGILARAADLPASGSNA
jgi:hypothetical protein